MPDDKKVKVTEHMPVAAEVAARMFAHKAGNPDQPMAVPVLVCRVCGTPLADRAGTPAKAGTGGACCKTPKAALLVDGNSLVFDDKGRVVRAVHLE